MDFRHTIWMSTASRKERTDAMKLQAEKLRKIQTLVEERAKANASWGAEAHTDRNVAFSSKQSELKKIDNANRKSINAKLAEANKRSFHQAALLGPPKYEVEPVLVADMSQLGADGSLDTLPVTLVEIPPSSASSKTRYACVSNRTKSTDPAYPRSACPISCLFLMMKETKLHRKLFGLDNPNGYAMLRKMHGGKERGSGWSLSSAQLVSIGEYLDLQVRTTAVRVSFFCLFFGAGC